MVAPSVWREVLAVRREWHTEHPRDGIETWRADQAMDWIGRLDQLVLLHLYDAVKGRSDLDPRRVLLEVMAVCSSWVDAMDRHDSTTEPARNPGTISQ